MMSGSARTFNPNVKQSWTELREQLQRVALMLPLSSYDWTGTAPGANDDITKGWRIGSKIITNDTHVVYECSSNAAGAAVWQQMIGTNPTAGSGGVAGSADLDGTVDYLGVALAHGLQSGKIVRVTLNDLVAASASGLPIVDGEGTFVDKGTSGEVSLDVKIGFDVPFFSLATPEAI